MIDLITSENRDLFENQLQQMWEQRYKVFVEKMGWDLPCKEGLEIDQFDTAKTNYLLAIDDDHHVAGAARYIPTTEPFLLSELFPELCEGEIPRGKSIWEASRGYMLPTDGGFEARIAIANELMIGSIEFCLLFDIRQLIFEFNIDELPRFLSFGWDTSPLGLPKEIDGETVVASAVKVTPTTLSNMREKLGIEEPVLRFRTHATAA